MRHGIDCHSLIENRDADFRQVSALVENIRESLNAFRTEKGHIRILSFEISQQMITPIQNSDDLFGTLFKETESELNEEQRKYLTICERALASFYCHIQNFLELHNPRNRSESISDASEQAKKLAYEFYFNASYELRTPYFLLKGYSQSQILMSTGAYSPPFVPENQDKFDKINYWIDELGKFIADLPSLWRANEPEDAT